jgi:hypothetical protein
MPPAPTGRSDGPPIPGTQPPARSLLTLAKGANASDARGINNAGQVTGVVYHIPNGNSTTSGSVARWEANGTVTTLISDGTGLAINDVGEIAGRATNKQGVRYPFLFVNGKTYDLSGKGVGSFVWGLNASGQVVDGTRSVALATSGPRPCPTGRPVRA